MFGLGGAFLGFGLTPINATQQSQFAYPAVGGGIGVILGFVIVFGLIFVWNLFRAPYKQRDEARQRIRDIEEAMLPHISVKAHSGRRISDWEKTEHLMWAELQVTNTNTEKELNDVEVNIVKCLTIAKKQDSPNPNDFLMWDFLNLNPFCVYWSERQAQPKQMSLAIPGGATRCALIAFEDNSNGGNFNFNTPLYNWIVGGVKIDIEISSCKSVLWRGSFYIECHPNYYRGDKAKFEFVEWDKWTTNRNIVPLASDKEGSQR